MDRKSASLFPVIAVTLLTALQLRAATFTVNAADDSAGSCTAAHCSLRQAITSANLSSGNTIAFNLPVTEGLICPPFGRCVPTFSTSPIVVGGSLPFIVRQVTIDGTTQPLASAGAPFVEVRGSGTGVAAGTGLFLSTGSYGSVIRGLSLTHFDTGIEITSNHNQVSACSIGLDESGAARGNLTGVRVEGDDNLIGGPNTNSVDRNVISGNTVGVLLCKACRFGTAPASGSSNQVAGNFIGTNLGGSGARGNVDGVEILGPGFNAQVSAYLGGPNHNIIGGTSTGQRNVISGNSHNGVRLETPGLGPNFVGDNLIGLGISGSSAVANGTGILLDDAPNTTVGFFQTTCSPEPCLNIVTSRNWISGNAGDGIEVFNTANTVGVAIAGNCIGTDDACTAEVGNGGDGVDLNGGLPLQRNRVGGTGFQDFNIIAGNQGAGVRVGLQSDDQTVTQALGWSIRENRMSGNGSLGIDDSNGVPLPVGSFNIPVVTSASSSTISGTVKGSTGHLLTLDFYGSENCSPSGFGEGAHFLGTTTVTPASSSTPAAFAVNVGAALPGGDVITATVTDPNGTTFEFSKCQAVTP
jgi:CSLREA domain-containing protein